nr:hypothetical protein CFP56_76864 [Quercus suber]
MNPRSCAIADAAEARKSLKKPVSRPATFERGGRRKDRRERTCTSSIAGIYLHEEGRAAVEFRDCEI